MVFLIIDLTGSDLATTWQDKIATAEIPFKVMFAGSAHADLTLVFCERDKFAFELFGWGCFDRRLGFAR